MVEVALMAASVALALSVLVIAGMLAAIVWTLIDWVAHSQIYTAAQNRLRITPQPKRRATRDELHARRNARHLDVYDQDRAA